MTVNELFDLVAPIAICGGADCEYEPQAEAAWKRIRELDLNEWKQHGCTTPPVETESIVPSDDFQAVYHGWALDTYNTLFEAIVEANGPANLERGHDYWGAKGYKLPHQTSKDFELSGDSCGKYPWYETAALLIDRLREIE